MWHDIHLNTDTIILTRYISYFGSHFHCILYKGLILINFIEHITWRSFSKFVDIMYSTPSIHQALIFNIMPVLLNHK